MYSAIYKAAFTTSLAWWGFGAGQPLTARYESPIVLIFSMGYLKMIVSKALKQLSSSATSSVGDRVSAMVVKFTKPVKITVT